MDHKCHFCSGEYLAEFNAIHHRPECPQNPKKAPVASLALKRLEKAENPSKTSLDDVFEAAKAWAKESGAEHVIIFLGRDEDGSASATRFFQGGKFHYHAQIGLATEGIYMIRESAS